MKRILIDTNILLDYYRLSKQSLKSIDALLELIEKEEIEVIFPRQIIDEFFREKPIVSIETIKRLGELAQLEIRFPEYLAKFPESIKLQASNKKMKNSAKKILEECKKRIFNPNSSINKKISQLFHESKIIEPTPEILQRAYYRTLKGNPPRKNNRSFGDAIIWETVLSNCTDEELIIVSRDGDFESEVQEDLIHEFLTYEWKEKSLKFLSLEKGLGSFIKQPKIKNEVVKEEKEIVKHPQWSSYLDRDSIWGLQTANAYFPPSLNQISVGNLPSLTESSMQPKLSSYANPTYPQFTNYFGVPTNYSTHICPICGDFISTDQIHTCNKIIP